MKVLCVSQGLEDVVTDGASGTLAPVRDPEALASIIAEVPGDPARAAAIGVAGRTATLDLSWERNAKLTLGVCESVLAAAP